MEMTRPIERLTAAELGSMHFEPLSYVVEPLLAPGSTLLAGKPKTGKTWLAQELALAVSLGAPACGEWAAAKGDVLFFACEDNKRRMQSRLERLRPHGEWPHNLSISFGARSLGDGFDEDVRCWASLAVAPKLVIVDTFNFIRPQRSSERVSYQSDYADGSALTSLASELGISICVVHHLRKLAADDPLDAISGTTGIAAGFDTIIAMSRTAEGLIRLEGRGRDIAPLDIALRFDADTTRWSVEGDPAIASLSNERQAIYLYLQQAGEAAPKEIAIRTGLSHDSVRQIVRKMTGDGVLIKRGYGSYAIAHTDHSDHTQPASVNGVTTVNGVRQAI